MRESQVWRNLSEYPGAVEFSHLSIGSVFIPIAWNSGRDSWYLCDCRMKKLTNHTYQALSKCKFHPMWKPAAEFSYGGGPYYVVPIPFSTALDRIES